MWYLHHMASHQYIVPGLMNKLIHLYLNNVGYRLIFKDISQITAISKYIQDQLKTMYNLDSVLIPNGIDLTLFKPIKDTEKPVCPTIINVTAYNRLKGSDLLLKSFIAIKQRYPKTKLIARNLSKAEELPNSVRNDIIDLDFLPYEELPKWYAKADIYLLTSRWESFGLPILEAFASGIPVIAWDRSDARREHIINSNAGLLYKNLDELMRNIDEILNNYNYYAGNAINYARGFDWSIIAQRCFRIYNKVLHREVM